ncbi:MAG: DUF362 domain-containing protein, partial [Eggerthellaceae bacterium]|nr:DUF362 domain-containing protein [Eggerthellaceae bacterium]
TEAVVNDEISSDNSNIAETETLDSEEVSQADSPVETAVSSTLTTYSGEVISYDSLEHLTDSNEASVVYYTSDISAEGLLQAYESLGWTPEGEVAVKLSTGEPPASNYLDPELIKDLVQSVDGTIVECNTAYSGSRSTTESHYQVAEEHGFTAIADVQIQDEDGSLAIPVDGGSILSEDYVGSAFADYDSYIVLSHFKGHAMAGFGGSLKNISIGLASAEGKAWIHSGGQSLTSTANDNQDTFLESMAEAGLAVSDYLGDGDNIVYVNVLNNLSIDCDCDGTPADPEISDIGIMVSTDPVALDQACLDIVSAADGNESFVERVASKNGELTLEHAQEIGLGTRSYKLVDISG